MGSMTTKSRILPRVSETEWGVFDPANGKKVAGSDFNSSSTGSQTTYGFSTTRIPSDEDLTRNFLTVTERPFMSVSSEPDPKRPKFDDGHEFDTLKYEPPVYSHQKWRMTGLYGFEFKGCLNPIGSSFTRRHPAIEKMSQNDINFFGSKAIANTIPTRPGADLSTTIGEGLLSGPPVREKDIPFLKRKGDKPLDVQFDPEWMKNRAKEFLKNPAKAVSSGHLATQFQFLPFVSDVSKIINNLLDQTRLLDQYIRDGQPGRTVRRRFAFPTTYSTSPFRVISAGQCADTNFTANSRYVFGQKAGDVLGGDIYQEDRLQQKVWFSGSYSYLFLPMAAVSDGKKPEIYAIRERIVEFERKAQLLLGHRVTPETLWNMTPWSWLVDWKLAVGDALRNFTQFEQDSLVLRYGYLMRESRADRVYSLPGLRFNGVSPGPVSVRYVTKRKERYKATPFGFGIDPRSFTPYQWSILAALGLTLGGQNVLRNE